MTKIKVCRVNDYKQARAVVWQGADYLGFHFVNPHSLAVANPLLSVNRRLIREDGFTGGVMLTRTARFADLEAVIDAGTFHTLQIHCEYSIAALEDLIVETRQRSIKVIAVVDPSRTPLSMVDEINEIADYILVDHIKGGTGEALDESLLEHVPMARCFLAGGLNAANVAAKAARYQPYSIDVQTDTENPASKEKDLQRTHKLIQALRPDLPRYPRTTNATNLGLSITEQFRVDENEAHSLRTDADVVHVDLVDKTTHAAIPGVSEDDLKTLLRLTDSANTAICDVHIFASDSERVMDLLNAGLTWIREPRICYVHVRKASAITQFGKIFNRIRDRRIRPGIAVHCRGLTEELNAIASALNSNNIKDILLIGPSSHEASDEGYVRLVNAAASDLHSLNPGFVLALDRGVNRRVLEGITLDKFSTVTVGSAIWSASDPHSELEEVRAKLVRNQ